ncbi:hypothetical protein BKE30_00860 [Alkanindiges hydrocarboniclasticus]|uniref:Uncharacterized protein n=1 Tax=Alkanindiges hydrocarboniclasticus TaxID=1907941 RepID=A0A1S8CZJ8_9GAMM|nr:hypothetical protein [Alkanindiges hydrocarboniclasticus]ONG42088.1 hypothetical protein BKE30_00860 [Alkanindiges hydrocarboniclasticus]
MAIHAQLDIEFTSAIMQLDLIKQLIAIGWTFNDYNNQQTYLPVHDADNYNWQSDTLDQDTLFQIFQKKYGLKENIGIVMTWKDTQVGGEFIFSINDGVQISPSINRQLIADSSITNISWYLERTIYLLHKKGISFISFSYLEHL